jgi:uncharacterized protein (DUF1800 family)
MKLATRAIPFLLGFAAALSAGCAASPAPGAPAAPSGGTDSAAQALHVLNRLGFGPRPGDLERVLQMGVGRYVEQQLNPEKIEDGAVAARLSAMPTLSMSNAELFEKFELPIREARRQSKAEAGEGQEADLEKLKEMIPPENRPRRIIEELSVARVLRASDSQRQLNEVMADFWMNHFNVFAGKGLDRVFLTSFERDVVRPRMWGRFEDLLMATAKSPAMLFYLDNARSAADLEHRSPEARRREALFGRRALRQMDPETARRIQENAPKGINENYARELMELHTLGVDGGYTQKDVTELARVLTGWSIGQGGRGMRGESAGDFVFRAALHDVGSKSVLGVALPAGGGIEEGEAMIRFLARQPATARHIAAQLCQRLVADDPPQALVDRVGKTFLATGGDLRQTVRAIVTSPEFSDPKFYRAKVKSPFEYVVSAVRATGGVTDGRALARQLTQMGEPLYLCQPPTGYSDRADAWVNSGALIARMNFALALSAGQLPGTSFQAQRLLPYADAGSVDRSVDALAQVLLGGSLTESTRETIRQRLAAEQHAQAPVSLIAGLILGSPEFQKQ